MQVTAPRSLDPNVSLVELGDLFVREFDLAVMNNLGAVVVGNRYFVSIPKVTPPPYPDDYFDESLRRQPMPGCPVDFKQPHEAFDFNVNPMFILHREDPQLAMERWNDQRLKYVIPANGAVSRTINYQSGIDTNGKPYTKTITGPSKVQIQEAPWAYDLIYTIMWNAEGEYAETKALRMLKYVMKRFQPRGGIDVVDDQGNEARWDMMCDAPVQISELIDIANRVKGWSQTIKILGFFDLKDPFEATLATSIQMNTPQPIR